MCQKEATCENTERAQGTEKLTANANDGKHIRKSRKRQKGGNGHKKSKNFECNAESKATEQPNSTTETAEQEQRRIKEGRPKTAESKKQLIGTRLWLSDRKSFGKWKIKLRARGGKAILTELIDCAGTVRKSFAFLHSTLWAFIRSDLFHSVFLVFCSCFPFHSFRTSLVAPSFPLGQTNESENNNNTASPS
jgi:hypothetical protein